MSPNQEISKNIIEAIKQMDAVQDAKLHAEPFEVTRDGKVLLVTVVRVYTDTGKPWPPEPEAPPTLGVNTTDSFSFGEVIG